MVLLQSVMVVEQQLLLWCRELTVYDTIINE
jgi:hypothetical protein